MKKTILSTVFSSILALFLALILLVGSLCVYANSTVCDPQLLANTARSSGYCTELYEEIKYDWEDLLAITGVSEPDPILAVLTQEQVEADAIAYITASYTGSAKLDTSALKSALDEKVRAYVIPITPNGNIDDELEQNINDLVSACIKDYESSIKIPALPKILGAVNKVGKFLTPGLWAVAVAGIVLLVFLFFLQKKWQDTLYFAAISTATNAVMLLSATGLAGYYKLTQRLPIDASALKTLLVSYLQKLLDTLQNYGTFFALITALLIMIYLLITLIRMRTAKTAP